MNPPQPQADAVVIGAGAAGLMCAARAGQRGLRVVLIDHARELAEKIRISGGGRCNFTNVHASPAQYLGDNPDFCRSALAGYGPQDFLDLLRAHRIGWHEKHLGQLFCDERSSAIIDMLDQECRRGGVERWQPCTVRDIEAHQPGFTVHTDRGPVQTPQVVIATGGLSVPKIGATDFGHRWARRWGHGVVAPRPGLVPLTFDAQAWSDLAALSGVSLPAAVELAADPTTRRAQRGPRRVGAPPRFVDDLLFTHRGLSGPAVLQISSYWHEGQALRIDLLPDREAAQMLLQAKRDARKLVNVLADVLPARMALTWMQRVPALHSAPADAPAAQWKDRDLRALGEALNGWRVTPSGTQGWAKAEVTVGGVDTRDLDSRSMQSRRLAGLYFIGEVVDVTGWLGGYNFQWAWSSAVACAQALRSTK